MPRCKGCGAPIDWRKGKNGKWIPVDVESKLTAPRMLVVTALGDVVWVNGAVEKDGAIVGLDPMGVKRAGRVAHFATCPHADRFRGTGEGDGSDD